MLKLITFMGLVPLTHETLATIGSWLIIFGIILGIRYIYLKYFKAKPVAESEPDSDSDMEYKQEDSDTLVDTPTDEFSGYELFRDITTSTPLSPIEEDFTQNTETIQVTEELLDDVKETIKSEQTVAPKPKRAATKPKPDVKKEKEDKPKEDKPKENKSKEDKPKTRKSPSAKKNIVPKNK